MAKKKKNIRKKTLKRKKQLKISILGKHKIKKYAMMGMIGVFCLFILFFITINPQNNLFSNLKENSKNMVIKMTANIGFKIKEVNLHGREYTDAELILAMLNVQAGDPIFTFDTDTASRFLSEISWIKNVKIRRKLPDTIDIHIEEKQPIAIWQYNNKLSVIDKNGTVLTSKNLDKFSDLPIVVGRSAPKKANNIINIVNSEPEIAKKLKAMINISNRRWDLKLQNNTTVKLPAKDTELALSKLRKLHKEKNILDKDLKYIDMRLNDRIIIKPANTNVKKRQKNKKIIN